MHRKSIAVAAAALVCLVAAPIALAATIYGGPGDNNLVGTNGNDFIYGAGGNDVIAANGGNDRAYGETGRDTVAGASGSDVVSGGSGGDGLSGGSGSDWILGGTENDLVFADDGVKDIVDCGAGNDRVERFDVFVDELHHCERYGPYPGRPLYPN
jgi:Ca2+-binding RTX toxin-like protein